ncbi:MAG: acyl-CoA desaturase [Schleiferiaceae bacterium]|nr:acyl-CoA desaturase [Schleiferiaceae bacterium]
MPMIDSQKTPRTVQFAHTAPQSFGRVLRKRVNQYFREAEHSQKGNQKMYYKTAFMLGLYFLPYLGMLLWQPASLGVITTFFIMGLGMSGIGMNVMHDAVHGAYARRHWINRWLGATIYLISGNATTWRFQHNVLHHTFTNIEGLDEDLETSGLLRLHPDQPWKKFHRHQAWYAPFLYGLLTLNWVVMKDFKQLLRYQQIGLAQFSKKELRQEWLKLIGTKILYFSLFIVLPIIFTSAPWYGVLLGFAIMHFTAGFILSFIFQLAHAVDQVRTFTAPDHGKMEDAWMEHQLHTTANFARNSPFLTWYLGGLNYQVEHHLFPNICHIHYPAISGIVEQTAREFDLPYHEHPRFMEAVRSHLRSLKMYAQPTPALN